MPGAGRGSYLSQSGVEEVVAHAEWTVFYDTDSPELAEAYGDALWDAYVPLSEQDGWLRVNFRPESLPDED